MKSANSSRRDLASKTYVGRVIYTKETPGGKGIIDKQNTKRFELKKM